jgi:predicted alpha/beta superfamily hydrolase
MGAMTVLAVRRPTEVRELPRASNGRDYLLYVALPDGYSAQSGNRFPVLYLCDGYWNFDLVKAFYHNLLYDQVIPEFILVGFGYQGENPDFDKLRAWDYTPVADQKIGGNHSGTGHAADFLRVLEREIIPFVESEYRVDSSYRVLGGSSYGGLFTVYTLFTKPELFQGFIAPSPAVTFSNEWIFGYAHTSAAERRRLPTRLYLTAASREWPRLLDSLTRFDAQLRADRHEALEYEFRLIDGERHAGSIAEAFNRGVRFAFAPIAPQGEYMPM